MCVFNNPLCFFKVYTYTLMCAGKHIDNCGMHIRVKEGWKEGFLLFTLFPSVIEFFNMNLYYFYNLTAVKNLKKKGF